MNLSGSIERMKKFEDKLGITFNALSVYVDDSPDEEGEYSYKVSGEIVSEEDEVEHSIDIIVVFYDSSGSIIDADEKFIMEEDFMGFDILSLSGFLRSNDVDKVKIFPKKA